MIHLFFFPAAQWLDILHGGTEDDQQLFAADTRELLCCKNWDGETSDFGNLRYQVSV